MNKRISALLTVLLMLLVLVIPVSAEIPDPQRKGSLKLQMTFDGESLDGGSITLFYVAKCVNSGRYSSFRLIDELSGGPDLTDLDDPELALTLAALAREAGLPAIEAPIENGYAVFSSLECGLYVVTQQRSQATKGFDAIHPFLISLPRWDNGTYVYDLVAAPKVPLVPIAPPPTVPTVPTPPPDSSKLPQTGQMNWPIPVLAVLGMAFFVAGWILTHDHRGKHHEK